MPSVSNTFAPPGIEPGPFGTLTDDATHLAIQPSVVALLSLSLIMLIYAAKYGRKLTDFENAI